MQDTVFPSIIPVPKLDVTSPGASKRSRLLYLHDSVMDIK